MAKPDRQPTVSLRQVKFAREQATLALMRFLSVPERPSDPDVEAWAALAQLVKAGLGILSAIAKGNEPSEDALAILTNALNRPIKEVAFRFIGELTQLPKKDQFGLAAYFSTRHRDSLGVFTLTGPVQITMDGVRHAAEALRQYLELIPICGMVHSACLFEGCLRPVVGGRGNKKFCSDEHRIAFWSYDRQREYFQRKQRETYRVRTVTKKGVKKHGS